MLESSAPGYLKVEMDHEASPPLPGRPGIQGKRHTATRPAQPGKAVAVTVTGIGAGTGLG